MRTAIVEGDFATASRIVEDVLGASRMQNWRFHPFDGFLADVIGSAPLEFEARLDQWVTKEDGSATPLLLRAQYAYDSAWLVRGRGFASTVSEDRQKQFTDGLQAALEDVNHAIQLSDTNPFAHQLRLRILQSGGSSQSFFAAFNEAVEKYPNYYPLYEVALTALEPRWGGTTNTMKEFVQDFAGSAPRFSPLKLLYLSLYGRLLENAELSCRTYGNNDEERSFCIDQLMRDMDAKRLEAGIAEALDLYDHTDKYQFGLAVKPIISEMLRTPGGGKYSGTMLQRAATSMHSDTQLEPEEPGSNDYIVDELVALSWQLKAFHDNAAAKYHQALQSVEHGVFPHEDEKHLALAHIYQSLSDMAADQQNYADQIAYQQEAVLHGVPWQADQICRGYHKLEEFDRAIETCTEAIELTGNHSALYWRGSAYSRSGQQEAALMDLRKVADLEDYLAPYAAIEISMIYFGRNDLKGALEVLNTYSFLYDVNRTAASQVAVAYNNRCYAYMELGELEQALEDCTQSLNYGSIPDAFRKHEELATLLKP